MVTPEVERVMLIMISFSGEGVLNEYCDIAEGYLHKHLDAKNIQKTLVRGEKE